MVTQKDESEQRFCMGTTMVVVQCIMFVKALTISRRRRVPHSLFSFLSPTKK